MRTTVTLDPDVYAMPQAVMKEQGLSCKEVLNGALRSGLRKPRELTEPFL
ncbi:MAG: hypothetical protein IT169_03675 [Bryobacterales bacterium]|nr:hypothetical protein [Bryobacterales bacterium]